MCNVHKGLTKFYSIEKRQELGKDMIGLKFNIDFQQLLYRESKLHHFEFYHAFTFLHYFLFLSNGNRKRSIDWLVHWTIINSSATMIHYRWWDTRVLRGGFSNYSLGLKIGFGGFRGDHFLSSITDWYPKRKKNHNVIYGCAPTAEPGVIKLVIRPYSPPENALKILSGLLKCL